MICRDCFEDICLYIFSSYFSRNCRVTSRDICCEFVGILVEIFVDIFVVISVQLFVDIFFEFLS